jgi:hypothetical protein
MFAFDDIYAQQTVPSVFPYKIPYISIFVSLPHGLVPMLPVFTGVSSLN